MSEVANRIAEALRVIAPEGKLKTNEIPLINTLAAMWQARIAALTPTPPWIIAGYRKLGQKEIVGPKHNSWIAQGWAKLNATWFNTDETPWCGFYIADTMNAVGLPYPGKGEFARALAWASYGVACKPQVGAIGVKKRTGGNHVFFIVGQTPDGLYFKCLGGNQNNGVNVIDILKTQVFAIRWPAGVPQANIPLPIMPAGTINANEG